MLLILALLLQIILSSCRSQTEQYMEELKQYIPDLKKLIVENEEIFSEIRVLSKQVGKTTSFYIGLDSTQNDAIIVTKHAGDNTNRQSSGLGSSELFTNEEKDLIRLFFSLSENEVSINRFGSGNGFGLRPDKNLVRMDLLYDEGDSLIEEWKDRAAYWEEILDNWYAIIIVSPPM